MNVLEIGAFAFPLHQGSQVYVAGLSRALARAGHRVRLAAYGGGTGAFPEGVEPVLPRRTGRVPTASGPHLRKPWLDAVLVEAVARAIRREAPDVIHAHHVEAPLVARAALRLAGRRVPVVWTPHTRLSEELPVYLPARVGPLAATAGEAFDRAVARTVDGAVALSRRAAETLTDWGVSPVAVVPPGVDPEEPAGGDAAAARARWDLGDGPWVVYTGNTDAYQDLDVLVRAMARVPAGLLVVTGGEVEHLAALARAEGIGPERLRLVRSASFDDARDALAAATVAALPRAVCAGFPVKLLNMLAAGRVVVAASGSAQPVEGVIPVPDRDPAAMAGALRAVLADGPMRTRLGEAARRAVAARWSWDVRAREVVTAFEAVLRRA